jgi:hypothetical protein
MLRHATGYALAKLRLLPQLIEDKSTVYKGRSVVIPSCVVRRP